MNTDTLFSHNSDEWSTPSGIFTELDNEFHFNLDPCATAENHKCERYFDKQQDGLSQKWGGVESSAIHHIQKLEIG
jgi:site-specific DNA-methyltransferase (adenine-specific)